MRRETQQTLSQMYLRRSLNAIICYMSRSEQESFEGSNGDTCSNQGRGSGRQSGESVSRSKMAGDRRNKVRATPKLVLLLKRCHGRLTAF